MDLEHRVAKLERSVRWWRVIAGAAVVAFSVAVVGAQQQNQGGVAPALRTKGLVVVNAKGEPVFTVGATQSGGGLLTLATGEGGEIMMGGDDKSALRGPFVTISGGEQTRIGLHGTAQWGGRILLHDKDGKISRTVGAVVPEN